MTDHLAEIIERLLRRSEYIHVDEEQHPVQVTVDGKFTIEELRNLAAAVSSDPGCVERVRSMIRKTKPVP